MRTMPKEEWGVKRVCPKTGKRFYDMNRNPIVSPYTGEVVEIETGRKSSIALSKDKKAETAKAAESEMEDAEVVLEDDEDSTDVDLADDVLDDEDEDDTVALDDLTDVASKDDDS